MMDDSDSSLKMNDSTNSDLKDTPSKKEQSVKEQLEQDWAEDDSRDPTDDVGETEGGKTDQDILEKVPLVENVGTDTIDSQLDIVSSKPSVEPLSGIDLATSIEASYTPTLDSTSVAETSNLTSKDPDTSPSLVSYNSVQASTTIITSSTNGADLPTGIESSFNNPLDAALDAIDSNTEAAFDNIIDSALASATAAPSMPTISATESESTSEQSTISKLADSTTDASGKEVATKTTDSKPDTPEKEKKTEDDEEEEESGGKRKMRMHLTSQMMQKLLKEGNMEKLPNGSYKIKAEALKELQNNMPRDEEEEDEEDDEEEEQEEEDEDEEEEEDEDDLLQTGHAMEEDKIEDDKSKETSNEEEMMDTSDIADSNQRIEVKEDQHIEVSQGQKRRSISPAKDQPPMKKKIPKFNHNYMSDYNSSEEDEESPLTVLRENIKSMLPRKGKYNTKGVSFLEEVHKHLFPEDEDEDSLSDLSDYDIDSMKADFSPKANDSSASKKLCSGTSSVEAKLGINGSTTLRIVATGDVKEVQGKEFEVYNLTTATNGCSTETTPLMIPKSTGSSTSPKKKQGGPVLLYHKPHVRLEPDDPNAIEELEDKRMKLRKYKEQLKLLRLRYLQLVEERMSKPGFNTLADLVNAASKFMTDDQLIFTTMQLKSGCVNTQGIRWSPREKILALGIYLQNTAQYDQLRQLFHLPHKNVLDKWLDCIAKNNPIHAKKLMYHIYTKYAYKALG